MQEQKGEQWREIVLVSPLYYISMHGVYVVGQVKGQIVITLDELS